MYSGLGDPLSTTEQHSPGTLTTFVSQLREADLELPVQLLWWLWFATTERPAPVMSAVGLPERG